MKYMCPQCGNTGTCKLWADKRALNCPICNCKVFNSIKNKLTATLVLSAACGAIVTAILRDFGANVWLRPIMGIGIFFAIYYCIEYVVCNRANNKALSSNSKTKE